MAAEALALSPVQSEGDPLVFMSQANVCTVQLLVPQPEASRLDPGHQALPFTPGLCCSDPRDNDVERFQLACVLFCPYI